MNYTEQQRAARTRLSYPPGIRLELISMGGDPRPVPPGTRGTVQYVDDLGQIGVAWDNGSSLSLIPKVDCFRKLTMGEVAAEQAMEGMVMELW